MARPLRIEYEGAFYHVTSRGNSREVIYFHKKDKEKTGRGEVTSPSSSVVTPYSKKKPTTKQGGETPPLQKNTLGQVLAYFKYQSAKEINQIRNTPGTPYGSAMITNMSFAMKMRWTVYVHERKDLEGHSCIR